MLIHSFIFENGVRLYERLVIVKHRLGRIYCHIPAVKELYLRRWKEKDWDEHEERDTNEFLQLEKEIYLGMFPHNKQLFEDEEGDMDEDNTEVAEDSKMAKRKRSGGSKKVVEIDDNTDDLV